MRADLAVGAMNRRGKTSSALLGGVIALALAAASAARASTPRPADARATEANIARLTTNLLERSQFAHHPLDAELAGKLLDRYLDALDGTRSLFLKADLDEFTAFRATLAQATRVDGDTRVAHTIFARYLERLGQQVAYSTALLRSESFDFTGHDRFSFDREHAVRPRDLPAAQELWRQQVRAEYLQEKLGDKKPKEIVAALTRRHGQQLRTMKALSQDEVLELYLDALTHVYDPHSDYLGHEEMESLAIAMNLSLYGIGASLTSEDGAVTVRGLIPGGPAAKSGLLKPGDRIVAVAQGNADSVDISNMPLTRVVGMIRGPKGSPVTLTILPPAGAAGASRNIQLVRAEIKLEDQQAKARIIDLPSAGGGTLRVGVVDLPSFYSEEGRGGHGGATADVARLLTKLKAEQVRGVVLDLRRNGGGSLQEAIDLTGLFIRQGPVVQTRDSKGAIEVEADRDPSVLYDGPLVVLTSRFSASASEIVAGALQDYGRAVIVGDTSTFGKGTVQTILPLAEIMDRSGLSHAYDPGALKVTTSKFYRPSGASTELRGVASDIVVPSGSEVAGVGEAKLTDPLPWDTVPSARYDRLNRVAAFLPALRDGSARRVAVDGAFSSLRQEIAELKQTVASGSVSLNEGDRRREVADGKSRQAEIEKQGRAAAAARSAYEITVKNAALPGLPQRVVPKPPKVAAAHDGKSASGTDTLADDTADRTPADDLILNEALLILGDYARLQDPKGDPKNARKNPTIPPSPSIPESARVSPPR
jgi:carboxyl-terminal processing protease